MIQDPRFLDRVAGEAGAVLDWALHRARRRARPYLLQPYRGHGNADAIHLSGRVLRGAPVPPARPDDHALRNLLNVVRRFGSDEVPAARVRASAGGVEATVLADDEGFFEVTLPVATSAIAGEAWREVALELLDPAPAGEPVRATGIAIVPPAGARFGVVSDIDDTVIRSDVTNLARMLRAVLLTNAHTRPPFPGVAAFYRALHDGIAGQFTNPVFYVSSGPWNLYDLIEEVLEVHDVPAGPLYLKDWGIGRELLLTRGHEEHKLAAIEQILTIHEHLPFVLIGDSGQRDPEIYREVARRHPGRIRAIYIRDASSPERDAEIHAIAADASAYGAEMVFVRDTDAAAHHAVERGLIDEASLAEIRESRAAESSRPR